MQLRMLERSVSGKLLAVEQAQVLLRFDGSFCRRMIGSATAEVAGHAGRLLERSLLGELRAVVARALSGLDMFSGDLSELLADDAFAPGTSPPQVCLSCVMTRISPNSIVRRAFGAAGGRRTPLRPAPARRRVCCATG